MTQQPPKSVNKSVIGDSQGLYQYYLLSGAHGPAGAAPHYIAEDGSKQDVPAGSFGNFAGLDDDKLDAIRKMGMSAVWLSPVYAADPTKPGYTYNATDYYNVNTLYGSLDDLKSLVNRAHAKGLGVVLDEVFNHTANVHPWFQASRDPNHLNHTQYKDYYVWQDPILVGAEEKKQNPAVFAKAFGTDEELRAAVLADIAQGGDGKSALPRITIPLRNSKGKILHKKNLDGTEQEAIASVDVVPTMDWWARDAQGLMSRVVTTDGESVAPDHSNIPKDRSGNQVWIALPMKDEQGRVIYPPNNFVNIAGERAWDYDAGRKQMYCHLFDDSMPDLNIGNKAVNDELLKVGNFWKHECGVDGFRMDAARQVGTNPLMVASGLADGQEQTTKLLEKFPEVERMSKLDRQLFLAGMTSNPPNTLRELFKDQHWESPSPSQELLDAIHSRYPATKKMSEEDMLMYVGTIDVPVRHATETGNLFSGGFRLFLHPRDIGQPTGQEFWSAFSDEMKRNRPDFAILHEFGDDPRLAQLYKEAGAGDYFYLSSLDSSHGIDTQGKPSMQRLKRDVKDTLDAMPGGVGVNWTPDNHDTSRFMTRMGFDPACPPAGRDAQECIAGQKLLLQFISHLPGNVTLYNGTELGLGTPQGKEIKAQDGRDPFDYFTRFTSGNLEARNHDFARGAYPWSPKDFDANNLLQGQGRFFKTADSWQGRDWETQNQDPNSVLHAFKKAMRERQQNPILSQTGEMKFLKYDFGNADLNNNVLIYARSNAEGLTQLFVDNFTNKPITLDLDKLLGQHAGVDALMAMRTKALLSTSMMAEPYKITVGAYQEEDIGRPLTRESTRVASR